MSYGTDILYQRFATEARRIWLDWNAQIASSTPSDLPQGLSPQDRLFEDCGFMRIGLDAELTEFEKTTLEGFEREGLRDTQYVVNDVEEVERAKKELGDEVVERKFDPLRRKEKGKVVAGVYDATAGFTRASKACVWVRYLCERAEVKFVLGEKKGKIVRILKDEKSGRTKGIITADGKVYDADLIVVAGEHFIPSNSTDIQYLRGDKTNRSNEAGGWTPSLIPQVRPILETTAGSVAFIQLPPASSRPDLWDRFSPSEFPVFAYGGWSKGLGLGGFPRTEEGIIKIGYRGTKYTNYETATYTDGSSGRVSVPRTAWTKQNPLNTITRQAMNVIKDFVAKNLPELTPFGITGVRNCWYTDSIDNDFVVAEVPGQSGLVVCSGGSGHGFKFLPVLGREVVKIIEARSDDELNEYGRRWRWRDVPEGEARNGLEEGEAGPRVLEKQELATDAEYKFSNVDVDGGLKATLQIWNMVLSR